MEAVLREIAGETPRPKPAEVAADAVLGAMPEPGSADADLSAGLSDLEALAKESKPVGTHADGVQQPAPDKPSITPAGAVEAITLAGRTKKDLPAAEIELRKTKDGGFQFTAAAEIGDEPLVVPYGQEHATREEALAAAREAIRTHAQVAKDAGGDRKARAQAIRVLDWLGDAQATEEAPTPAAKGRRGGWSPYLPKSVRVPGGGRLTSRLTHPGEEISAREYGERSRRMFLAKLGEHGGIEVGEARDLTGEGAVEANKRSFGLFRNLGRSLDHHVEWMVEDGYISRNEVEADAGGAVERARDLIRAALGGEAVLTVDGVEEQARRSAAEEADQAERIDALDQDREEAIAATIAEQHAEGLGVTTADVLDFLDELPGDTTVGEVAAMFNGEAFLVSEGITDEGVRESILEGAAIRAEGGEVDYEQAVRAASAEYLRGRQEAPQAPQGEGKAPAAESAAEGQAPGLTLEGQTAADLKAAAEAAEASKAAAVKAEKAAADAERAAKVAAEIKQRAAGAAADFKLGQSAEDNLSGQHGMFDEPAPKPPSESEQDRVEREARAHYDRVVNLPDLSQASISDLERARVYAGTLLTQLRKAAQRGEPYNKAVLEAVERDDAAIKAAIQAKSRAREIVDELKAARTDRIGDQHKARDAAAAAEGDAEAPATADEDGVEAFLATMPAMRRAKALGALNGLMTFDGKTMRRREAISERIMSGATIVVADLAGTRRLQRPNGAFLGESQITKTGMDYAAHLIAARAKPVDEKQAAADDLKAALADLADLLVDKTGGRKGVVPFDEQKLLPILTRLFDAAFRLGKITFKEAARFVLETIREKLGMEVADSITIDNLQGAYIGMAGKYRDKGADRPASVAAVESIEALNETPAAPAEKPKDPYREMLEKRRAKRAEIEKIMREQYDAHGIVVAERKDGTARIAMTADAHGSGPFRVTSFSKEDGKWVPVGHRVYNSIEESAAEFVGESFEIKPAAPAAASPPMSPETKPWADAAASLAAKYGMSASQAGEANAYFVSAADGSFVKLRAHRGGVTVSRISTWINRGVRDSVGSSETFTDLAAAEKQLVADLAKLAKDHGTKPPDPAPAPDAKKSDDRKPMETFDGPDGMQSRVFVHANGYSVGLYDRDGGEMVPHHRIFPNGALASAYDYAKSLVAGPKKEPAAPPPPAAPTFRVEGDKLVTNAPTVEYVTQKGKTLTGVLWPTSADAAKAIDPWTWRFKGGGGYFIREQHIKREGADAPRTDENLASDRPAGAPAGDQVGQGDGGGTGGNRPAPGGSGQGAQGGSGAQSGIAGVRDGGAPDGGSRPDRPVPASDGGVRPAASAGVGSDAGKRGGVGRSGVPDGAIGQGSARVPPVAGIGRALTRREASDAQRAAEGAPTGWADAASIEAALPALLPLQRGDVLFAERRLVEQRGAGVLFTNGTGTGKTFTGLGIIKRFVNAGHENALVVVPSAKIADDWIEAGRKLNLNITQLADTKTAGAGASITTYANFYQNSELLARSFELIVADESQNINQNADGTGTQALDVLRAMSGHARGEFPFINRLTDATPAGQTYNAAVEDVRIAKKEHRFTDADALQARVDELKPARDAEERKFQAIWNERVKRAEGALPGSQTKVVFLSATPFAHHFSLDYAEGFLFNYDGPAHEKPSGAYNAPSHYQSWFMRHLGYSMRFNKLTRPGPKINVGLLEQEVHQYLRREGSLSGRRLEVEHDYDRRFILTESALGTKIDQGIDKLRKWAREQMSGNGLNYSAEVSKIRDRITEQFSYHNRMYLLEALKAREVVGKIEREIAAGRKVVVFHDFNKGGGFHPFKLPPLDPDLDHGPYRQARESYGEAMADYIALDFEGLDSPINAMKKAFGESVAFFNGTETKRARSRAVELFNANDSKVKVIVVQSDAGGAGISLHDTSGRFPRALYHLGMPGKPVTLIQNEGRIYRVGQASDAMFRYPKLGTTWEAGTFAQSIATRSATVENFALGAEARGLKQSIINSFEAAELYDPPADGDGKGGKELDRGLALQSTMTPFQQAKSHYYAAGKVRGRRDQRVGNDYFPTPEPIGFKMVEWLSLWPGESMLEPSAGHGAIARYAPFGVRLTAVEPSAELAARAKLTMPENSRIEEGTFEDHHVSNKYSGIAMNPPYGHGGSLAFDHVAKAATHLKDGGRIVALVPTGPAADKRMESFLYGPEGAGLYLVADIKLPAATFEAAGTGVRTRILVIEKQEDASKAPNGRSPIDLSDAADVEELFNRIENISMPERPEVPLWDEDFRLEERTKQDYGKTTTFYRAYPRSERAKRDNLTKLAKTNNGWVGSIVGNPYTFRTAEEREAFLDAVMEQYLSGDAKFSTAPSGWDAVDGGETRDFTGSTVDGVRAALRQAFGSAFAKREAAGAVHVVQSVSDLPDGISQRSGAARVRGVYLTSRDEVWLVADNLTDANFKGVFIHEVGVHYGLPKILGADKWESVLRRVRVMRASGNAVVQAAYARVPASTIAENVDEEAVAYLAQTAAEANPSSTLASIWRDIVAAIRAFLFERFGIGADSLTDADIVALANAAVRRARPDGGPGPGGGTRASTPDGDRASIESRAAQLAARFAQAFQVPTSKAIDLATVLDEMGDKRFVVQKLETRDQSNAGVYTIRKKKPGITDVATVTVSRNGTVELDIANWTQGTGGSLVYQAVATFAHNNGLVFIGDPAGLSESSVRRRTENMLSSALRHGTTRHIRPHEAQTDPTRAKQFRVRPMDWREGDDAHNLNELAATVLNNTLREVPELDFVGYDLEHGGFVNTHSGKPFTDADFDAVAAGDNAKRAHAGRATLKRVAYLAAVVRAAGQGGRDGVLAHLDRLSAAGLDPALRGIFYSRAPLWRSALLDAVQNKPPRSKAGSLDEAGGANSPAFRKWFGDSKIVDAAGNPLVVYHGTSASFDEFISHSPERVMYQDGRKLKRADSWDFNEERSNAPDSYHYLALSDVEFHAPADALESRRAELRGLQERNPGEKFYDSERVVRDLERLAAGGPITKRIENLPSGARPYFTPDKDYSFIARAGQREGGNVMPVYLAIKNPVYLNASEIEAAGWRWEKYAEQGYDGAIFAGDKNDLTRRDWIGGSTQIVAFDRRQIKSAIGNRGTFDPANPDIRFSETGNEGAPLRGSLTPKNGPLETPLRLAFTASGALKVWRGAFRLFEKLGSLALDNRLGETIKAGLVDKYGLDQAVRDRRDRAFAGMMGGVRRAQHFLDRLAGITRAEAAALYYAATNADQEQVSALVANLPEASREVLDEIKALVDKLGQEQVRLGNMTAETFERNRWAYLHRSYMKWETEQTAAERASRALRTKGDQYKMRGIVQAIPGTRLMRMLPDWWGTKIRDGKIDNGIIGKSFTRYERRAPTGEPTPDMLGGEARQPGRLLEVVYWPDDRPAPARFDGWTNDGKWEVRRIENGHVVFWRDFTPEERQRMGEIDDIRYAMAKTLHQAFHDIEVGRYFEWLAAQYAKPESGVPRGAEIVTANDRLTSAYRPGTWVRVPDTTVRGTGAKVYGKLGGLYVPGPIWNDIRSIARPRPEGIAAAYDNLLRYWKISKTALSPAVHTNNVMANVVMADWHDLNSGHVIKALSVLLGKAGDADKRKVWEAFEDNGGELGMFNLTELQKDQLAPLLAELEQQAMEDGEMAGLLNASAFLSLLREGRAHEAWTTLKASKTAKAGRALPKAMIDLYAAEDQVFRLAAFIKAKDNGLSDREAGKFARASFLDYDINAPWIQALRRTALPFISFSYRAIPMLYQIMRDKPWKLAKLGLVAGALNALGYSLSGGDEDDERRYLPKEKAGKVWGLVPKLVRMPWNDPRGSPVFLDVRRWVPAGDVFDTGGSHSAVPLAGYLQMGGPLALFAELMLNRSGFTGKPITSEIDTGGEAAAKVADHIFKWAMPNLPIPNPPAYLMGADRGAFQTYAWTGIADAATGRLDAFGQEKSTVDAIASAAGVKLGAYPVDEQRRNRAIELRQNLDEIRRRQRAIAREQQRNGISPDEARRRIERESERARESARAFSER